MAIGFAERSCSDLSFLLSEPGIWLKKDAHGKRYGREAIRIVSNRAVDNLDFDYLVYPVDRDNIPSRKIPESMGGLVFEEKKVKKQCVEVF